MGGAPLKRVLIADDEMLVRVGLKTSIDWEAHGYQVVGEARNGKEALDMFTVFHPEIVITDISMPQMDGLEFITRLRELSSNVAIIILTHYDSFEYAKQAIGLHVNDYILKSDLTKDNLLAVLSRVESSSPSEVIHQKQHMEARNPLIDRSQAEQLRLSLEGADLDEAGTELLSQLLPGESFCLVACSLHNMYAEHDMQSVVNASNTDMLLSLSQEILSEIPSYRAILFFREHLVAVFNFQEYSKEKRMGIYQIVNMLKKNIKQFFNFDMLIGISAVHEGLASMPLMYGECCDAIEISFYNDMHISFFNESSEHRRSDGHATDEVLAIFRSYLEHEETAEYLDYLKKFAEQVRQSGESSFGREVLGELLKDLKRHGGMRDSSYEYLSFDDFYSFENLFGYVESACNELDLSASADGVRPQSHSYIIKQALAYLEDRFTENIALTDLAAHVDVSRSYLSFLFKKETGLSFSKYLTRKRIDKSKKLLKETSDKIYVIAEQVGFDNPYYFSKVFKEYTGYTCKEYRDKNFSFST
jgi:two-component system, response regulator YesN